MNERQIPESDWKTWRRLSSLALERYCSRVLSEVAQHQHRGGSAHERYLDLFRHLKQCDKTIGLVFDDMKRSNAFIAITNAVHRGLLVQEELGEFSPETRQLVQELLEIKGGRKY